MMHDYLRYVYYPLGTVDVPDEGGGKGLVYAGDPCYFEDKSNTSLWAAVQVSAGGWWAQLEFSAEGSIIAANPTGLLLVRGPHGRDLNGGLPLNTTVALDSLGVDSGQMAFINQSLLDQWNEATYAAAIARHRYADDAFGGGLPGMLLDNRLRFGPSGKLRRAATPAEARELLEGLDGPPHMAASGALSRTHSGDGTYTLYGRVPMGQKDELPVILYLDFTGRFGTEEDD